SADRRTTERNHTVEVDAASFACGSKIWCERSTEAPWGDTFDFVSGYRSTEGGQQNCRVAGVHNRRVVSAHNRLQCGHRLIGFAHVTNKRGGHESFADVGAGRGNEISSHDLCQYLVAHDVRKPIDLVVRMLGSKCQAQACRARLHR